MGNQDRWYPYVDIAAANAWLGRDAEAKAAIAELLKLWPDFTVQAYLGLRDKFSDNPTFSQQIERIVEGLRKAKLPEGEKKTD
jgi:hypothetical protein